VTGKAALQSIGEYLRAERRLAGLSLRELASRAGVSNSYLSQVERGLYQPSAEFLRSVAKPLNASAETLYAHAGFLDPATHGAPDVADAIARDPKLSNVQRRALIQMYRALLDTPGSA
jgi:transcriptional regulator with XRE-family HTH domain